MSMAVYIPFPVLKPSCLPCHSPVCSDNAHSTLRCYEACSSWDRDRRYIPLKMGFQAEICTWMPHSQQSLPICPHGQYCHPSWTLGQKIYDTVESSHTILTDFDFCNKDFLQNSPLFSSYRFPAYSQYSSEAVVPSARSETDLYVIFPMALLCIPQHL